jgi:hypothetical protein
MSKPILCVDFDGVIHSYTSKWVDETTIPDPPTKGALQWLWKANEWFDVQIYSSRSKSEAGVSAMKAWMREWATKEFGFSHPMTLVPFKFPNQKPPAFLTIDDRALVFEGEWEWNPADLLGFKPWNKR